MRIELAQALATDVQHAATADALREALSRSARDLGFTHFALSLADGSRSSGPFLIHDYPPEWEDAYISGDLAACDPVLRAAERSMSGFRWSDMRLLIPLTPSEVMMFETGQQFGLVDGYTVPRHLPGRVSATCTFATGPDAGLPEDMLLVAELVGAFAIATAERISLGTRAALRPRLTDRQRECLLWAARGKTDWEIARILGISHATVTEHLKLARERYDVGKRATLILQALFDGLFSFSDVFCRRY